MYGRRYYQDAYRTTFDATIVERSQHEGNLALVLDGTYFYPTSGGQPADSGRLNGQPVRDVYVRDDGAVVHVVEGGVWDDVVAGEIDWTRRFDHMQQHTGQHILSQAFIRVAAAETVSFHLSDNSVTIDLDTDLLQPPQIEAAELLANRVIWEDRPVAVRMVAVNQAAELDLRKLPPVDGEQVRLIDIADFDLTACGGTHVARTGEVGMIKIIKLERQRGQLRVSFLCGQRALLDYREKNSLVNQLSTSLTTGAEQIAASVDSMRDELQAARRQLRHQQNRLLDFEADSLLASAAEYRGVSIVRCAFDSRDPAELKALASRIGARSGAVALLGTGGERSLLILMRSADAPGQMDQLLKQVLPLLGPAGGGGSPQFAQGGGPPAPAGQIERALAQAEKLLVAQLP
jgi:alanyl-tRNA synthetase